MWFSSMKAMYSSDRGSGTRVLYGTLERGLVLLKVRDVQNGSDVETFDKVKVLAGWVTTPVDGVRLDRAEVGWRNVHAQTSR